MPGAVIIMRGDVAHGDAAFLDNNARLHAYLDAPDQPHEENRRHKVYEDEELRPFIALPPYI